MTTIIITTADVTTLTDLASDLINGKSSGTLTGIITEDGKFKMGVETSDNALASELLLATLPQWGEWSEVSTSEEWNSLTAKTTTTTF